MTKSLLSLALLLAAIFSTGAPAFGFDKGDGPGKPTQKRSIVLAPSAAGARHNASGTASWKFKATIRNLKSISTSKPPTAPCS